MELQSESVTTLHHEESVENEIKKPQTLKEKMVSLKMLITVEPILFAYLFSSALASGAVQNMPFEMGCRTNLKLNDTVCSDISVGIKYVAVLIGNMNAWSLPIVKAVPGILVLCFGSFSDRYKLRKPFFILPVIGEVFSAIGLMLCAAFINKWPIEVFFLLALILPAFFGGGQTVIMAIYSYITDISTKEERTTRIGFVELASIVLTPIAPALSGILFELIGYYGESIYIKLYAFREFKWKVDIYGYYHSFDITVHILGMFFAVTIFTKKFQLNDIILASMACIFKIISGVWYAFGNNVILFCIGPLISVFSGLFIIALRSLSTKLVDPTEIAKTQALFAVCEAISPIIYTTMFAKFYQATDQTFHGAFFLLSSALASLPLLILLGMYVVYKNNIDRPEVQIQKNENDIISERL